MTRLLPIIISVLLLMGSGFSIPARVQANTGTEGSIEFKCPLPGGRIGDPLPFTLRVILPPTAKLEPSSLNALKLKPVKSNGQVLQSNLFSSELIPFKPSDSVTRQRFIIRGVMRFYAPGAYILTPVTLLYRYEENRKPNPDSEMTASATGLQPLTSKPVRIHIAGLLGKESDAAAPIMPETAPPLSTAALTKLRQRQQLYYLILSISLLLTLFFIISCYRRRQKTDLSTDISGLRPEEIDKALRKAVNRQKVESHWRHLIEIDHLLRRYLLTETRLPETADGGRGTTFSQQIAPELDPLMAARLQLIWAEIDRVVAREIGSYPEFGKLLKELNLWLEEYGKSGKSLGGGHGV